MSAAHETPADPSRPKLPRPGADTRRILLVDDDEGIRSLCATLLKRLGYQVETRNDGAEAWAAIQANPEAYKLLMTDNDMPALGGSDLIERIRKAGYPIRILSISGSVQSKGRIPTPLHGVDAALPKPFTIQDLEAAVGKLLTQE